MNLLQSNMSLYFILLQINIYNNLMKVNQSCANKYLIIFQIITNFVLPSSFINVFYINYLHFFSLNKNHFFLI